MYKFDPVIEAILALMDERVKPEFPEDYKKYKYFTKDKKLEYIRNNINKLDLF